MCAVLAQAAQALITHSLNGEFGRYAAHAVICFLYPRTWSVHCACAQNQCPHAFLLLRSLTMSPCVASAGHPCAGSGTHVREHVGWRLLALGTTGGIGIDARTPLMRSVGAALAVEVAAACASMRARPHCPGVTSALSCGPVVSCEERPELDLRRELRIEG